MIPARDPRVTVAIPCFNAAGRLHLPLAGLADQPPDPAFEVVVVDNASTDGTGAAAERLFDATGLRAAGVRCRVVREDRKGLTFARIRGVAEARADLVCFLDDDNRPLPGYVAAGVTALTDPTIGLLVSRVFPRYEAPPPPAVRRREHLLAINCRYGEAEVRFGSGPTFAPTLGAGMWVRKATFLAAVPWQTPDHLLSDRVRSSLVCGGDIEIGWLIGRAGFDRVYCPALRVEHVIPPGRTATRYFVRLIAAVVRSALTLDVRYAGRPSVGRVRGLARLAAAVAGCPVLLARPDGLREALFAVAGRWAEVRGPYPSGEPAVNGPRDPKESR